MTAGIRDLLKSTRGLVLAGLVIRESLGFWTGHPYDLEVWLRTAYFVSHGANPYSAFMPAVPGLSFAFLSDRLPGVGYLPLWPLIVALLYQIYALVPGTSRFVLYFLLKQPPILGDVFLGYITYLVILRWSGRPESALQGLRFWMFFPYAILISAIWGMFDAVVAGLFLLFLILNRPVKGYTLVGLGILLKWLPVIYIPYNVLREKGVGKAAVALGLLVPIIVTVSVFSILQWDYVGVTDMARYSSHGGGGGMTYAGVLSDPRIVPFLASLGNFYSLIGFLWIPGVVVGGVVASRRFPGQRSEDAIQAVLLITSIFFLTRWGINEQYLLYLLPAFYIDIALWHPERKSLFTFTWVLGLLFLLANNDLLVRFFGPAFPSAAEFAWRFDNFSEFAYVRIVAMYLIGVLFTVHLIQLVQVFLNPRRKATPWLWQPFARLRSVPPVSG